MIASPKRSYVGFVLLLVCLILENQFNLTLEIWNYFTRQVQDSHITANVPVPSEFEDDLNRDLLYFFENQLGRSDLVVESYLLRKGATQSGVAYPKFYSWVKILDNKGEILTKGAVRVAAINKDHFEVTDFIDSSEIKADPDAVATVFPRLLLEKIQEYARTEN